MYELHTRVRNRLLLVVLYSDTVNFWSESVVWSHLVEAMACEVPSTWQDEEDRIGFPMKNPWPYLTFSRRIAKLESTMKLIEYSIIHTRHPSGRRSYHVWLTLTHLSRPEFWNAKFILDFKKEAQVRLRQVARTLTEHAKVDVKPLLAVAEVLMFLLFSWQHTNFQREEF